MPIRLRFPAYSFLTLHRYIFRRAISGRTFQPVRVSNTLGGGKDIAEGKGVHREVNLKEAVYW